jgi:excisionase family DNA binding protein
MDKIILTTQNELEKLIQCSFQKVIDENELKQGSSGTLYVNLKEASSFLNLATQTIYSLTSRRMIPFIKKGKKLYFKKSELEKWLNEGKKLTKEEIENKN